MKADDLKYWQENLLDEALQLNVQLNKKQAQQCLLHCQELLRWNRVHNLTSIKNLDEMLTLHVLDSLSVLPYIKGQLVIDIGTGGGFPGIPLAIANPEKRYLLIDANQKKIAFLRQLIYQLNLKNVLVEHARIEKFKPDRLAKLFQQQPQFSDHHFEKNCTDSHSLVARAFSDAKDILKVTSDWMAKGCQLILMKAKNPENELKNLPLAYHFSVIPVRISSLKQERNLVIIN